MHARLKELVIICGGLPAEVLADIRNAKLPELRKLELYLGVDEYGFSGSLDDVLSVAKPGLFPKLTYLGLKDSEIQDEIAQALADAPILDQLETLDLSYGTLSDAGAEALLARLRLEASSAGIPVRWVNDPADIAVMFDKRRCWEHLSRHGVRMPPLPALAGSIAGYEELQAAIRSSGMHRLFLKLACGSGAAGVIAYQCQPATGAELAVTTLEMEERAGETVFYNSVRLRQYRDHAEIRRMVDWLCGEGAMWSAGSRRSASTANHSMCACSP
ncbi:hypothetical protein J6TS7_07520 [Paenibacillus dendritiformis]|nr:hypothetical protein J6TS7_07520 [Paenibacillus dendritiformis]